MNTSTQIEGQINVGTSFECQVNFCPDLTLVKVGPIESVPVCRKLADQISAPASITLPLDCPLCRESGTQK